MTDSVYEVISDEELNRGERVEMVVDIYESADSFKGQELNTEMEDSSTKRVLQTQHPGSRGYRLTAVCLGLLCVLLLAVTAGAVLCVKFSNLTTERDQLQKERDGLEKSLSELGWRYFSSSIYYISTEMRSWTESRRYCRERGADLLIINSREEQDFIKVLRRDQTAWIGLIYRNTENVWRWVDGSVVETWFWTGGHLNSYAYCTVTTSWYYPVYYPVQDCNSQFVWICEKRIFG